MGNTSVNSGIPMKWVGGVVPSQVWGQWLHPQPQPALRTQDQLRPRARFLIIQPDPESLQSQCQCHLHCAKVSPKQFLRKGRVEILCQDPDMH